jgi:hypothetical protein
VPDVNAVGIEQQHRGHHFSLNQPFDGPAQEREHVGQRFPLDDAFENPFLAIEQRLVLFACADVAGQRHQEAPASLPKGPAADIDRE